ncbi:MAG: hypothetical protein HeimC2_19530 [Candidatus Heimdallarchaeota archaeon LC_2]|nr:MAG: hypothetical protein HeimC2_19530 [Candidatus Heimdallarchaeota archaeon LC_2]
MTRKFWPRFGKLFLQLNCLLDLILIHNFGYFDNLSSYLLNKPYGQDFMNTYFVLDRGCALISRDRSRTIS